MRIAVENIKKGHVFFITSKLNNYRPWLCFQDMEGSGMTDQITGAGVRGPLVSVREYMSLCTVDLLIHIK